MMILIFFLPLAAAYCPQWVCQSLNYTVCATLQGTQILANSNGCPTDFYCKLEDFYDWSDLLSPSSTKSFYCTRQNYDGVDSSTIDSQGSSFCGTRNPDAFLAVGSHPKKCTTQQDCKTREGWSTQCVCGLDGYFYCEADISSNAFDGYWKVCQISKNLTNDLRIDARNRTYWNWYQKYYVEIISAPGCLGNLLWEFQILSDLKSLALDSAVFLGISAVSTALLI
ncbi:unnamed protein product [Blepharisma stoltei]|uniref:Uncharacterized protein n=1 Tax=Blepharisma stoltei TaxID=1481888 RepID=A0AAU9JAU6_9CILI|nr:unnamed protein product [Blepharisma stoltei]